uniref:Uncharacterized protein n=1 Tax=Plectus sambesii TaxID=2011161 RepID=A0A914VVE0_9BILA
SPAGLARFSANAMEHLAHHSFTLTQPDPHSASIQICANPSSVAKATKWMMRADKNKMISLASERLDFLASSPLPTTPLGVLALPGYG